MKITRRDLLQGVAVAGAATLTSGVPIKLLAADQKTVKIGMNIPMTGDMPRGDYLDCMAVKSLLMILILLVVLRLAVIIT